MAMVRALTGLAIFVFAVQVSVSSAQASGSTSGATPDSGTRPAIFQRGPQALKITTSPNMAGAQLNGAGYRPATDQEVDGMEQTLEKYIGAFESLSIPQIRQVWPGLDREHEAAFKQLFSAFKDNSYTRRMVLECAVPQINGENADVQCRETITYGPAKGKAKQVGPARIAVLLKGQSSSWFVADMKGSQ